MKYILSGLFMVFLSQCLLAQDFVRVESGIFYQGNERYIFMGANYWYGMYLGADAIYGDRDRLLRELDFLQSIGVKNLRVLASSEGSGKYQVGPSLLEESGEYNDHLFEGLDFLLAQLAQRDMTAVLILNNFWMWSGGMPQYVSWADRSDVPMPDIEGNGSWDPFVQYSLTFFENRKAQKMFRKHVVTMLNRRNVFTGKRYKDDPAILSWQLANEPRGYQLQKEFRRWVDETSAFIKRKDKNHLVSIGSEGNTHSEAAGVDLLLDNQCEGVDYATVHLWIQNWGWYNPDKPQSFVSSLEESTKYLKSQVAKAEKLGKPIVIEEFGVSRDKGDFDCDSPTVYRDEFYRFVFEFMYEHVRADGPVQGCNFWSWAGEGRPDSPGGMWGSTDTFIGDPPHEKQGWYSVYDTDQSTIELIKKYAKKVDGLK